MPINNNDMRLLYSGNNFISEEIIQPASMIELSNLQKRNIYKIKKRQRRGGNSQFN